MDAGTWQRLEALFHDALAQPAADRQRWLQQACGGDPELLSSVQKMLAASAPSTDTLDRGVAVSGNAAPATTQWQPLSEGELIGSYRILHALGQGGMGEVYLAERADGQFEQQVALKVMRASATEHLQRFEAERQILARLEHPGIARLIDGGVLGDGRPYMVMEYVAGVPLADYCRERKLALRERLALFEQVCEAVEYAHANLVIHRDLKSGNILVNAEGKVKLLDFGVAKLISSEWTGDDETTRGTPLTPDHAAPEQLTGRRVTTATDVYALGVVLYSLLAGRAPWQHLRQQAVSIAINRILVDEPPRLSVAAQSQADAPVPARRLQGDLEAIVHKALRKSASERYRTAEALQEDLNRYRAGKVVQARATDRWYRFNRYLYRYRWPLAGSVVLVALLGGFNLRLALETQRAHDAERRALEEAQTSQAVSDYLVSLFEFASPSRTGSQAIKPKALVDNGLLRLDRHLLDRPRVRSRMLTTLSKLYGEMGYESDALAAAERGLATLPAGSEQTLEYGLALARVGEALEKVGRYDDASSTLQQAIELLARQLSFDDRRLLQARIARGLALVNRDQLQLAISELEPLRARLSAQQHAETYAGLMSVLAAAYTLGGDGARAIPMQQQVQGIFAELLGHADPKTVDAQAVLAHIHYYAGNYQESADTMRVAISRANVHFSPGTAELINMQRGLANALGDLGQLQEAIAIERQIVASYQQVGGDNPTLGISYSNLAADLNQYGDYPAAADAARRALQLLDYQAEPVEVVRADLMLARALLRQDQPEAALQAMQRPVPEGVSGVLGDGFRGLREILLAQARLALGELDAARQHLRTGDRILRASQPEGARVLILLDQFSGQLARAEGDLSAAVALLRSAWQNMAQARGAASPYALQIEVELAELLAEQGELDEARRHLLHIAPLISGALAPSAQARQRFARLQQQLQPRSS